MNDRTAPWHISNLKLIVGQIQQFLPLGDTPQGRRASVLLEKFDTTPNELTISDISELDIALHRLLPTESLLAELPMLRLRYKEAVGEHQYAVYRPFDVGATPNFDDPRLRIGVQIDCEILLIGLYREYALAPHREGLRRSFALRVINALIVYTVGWAVVLVFLPYVSDYVLHSRWPFLGLLFTVSYFGIIGGYISFLRRTQSLPLDTDALLQIEQQNSVRDLLWSSPLLGAVFAIILLLLFKSNLLSGGLFPNFDENLVPKGINDYAKLYFWSFVAGFAERFVPDVLDRIVQKSSSPSKQEKVTSAKESK